MTIFRKEKTNFDEMTATELEQFHDQIVKRVLWLNGLWLMFIVVMLVLWLPGGVILAILTVIKYWYDYHDTESQSINASFVALIFRKQVEEGSEPDD